MTTVLTLCLAGLVGAFTATAMSRRTARVRWHRVHFPETAARRTAGEMVRRQLAWLRGYVSSARRVVFALVVVGAGGAGLVGFGPVAGAVLAAYAATGLVLGVRRRVRREQAASHRKAVDTVAALAAELRAGLPVEAALATAAQALDGRAVVGAAAATVARRVGSAVEVAEASGAPLADVLDRLDVHLRAVDRARASALAEAAGASATAAMLALMPVAGVALGYLVGVDALQVLLHTPIGAACLLAAVSLQLAGLAWAGRLSRVEVLA